jgi:hypothetical protein
MALFDPAPRDPSSPAADPQFTRESLGQQASAYTDRMFC